jgi:hypothetical protein
VKEKKMSAQAQQPPITTIEPENLETIFITGGLVEAIDKQTVRIVAWIDQPSTHSRKIVCRLAAPLDVAMAMNVQMQEAFAKLLSELEQQNAIEKAYED